MPKRSAIGRRAAKCWSSSVAVSCTLSSGAPDSSNWPPGSIEMAPPFSLVGEADDVAAIAGSASSRGSSPSLRGSAGCRRREATCRRRGPARDRSGRSRSSRVPCRCGARDAGLQPAASHSTRSPRPDIGVVSETSRAIVEPSFPSVGWLRPVKDRSAVWLGGYIKGGESFRAIQTRPRTLNRIAHGAGVTSGEASCASYAVPPPSARRGRAAC